MTGKENPDLLGPAMKTIKDLKMKSGEIVPRGTEIQPCKGHDSICLVQGARLEPYRIKYTSAIAVPDIDELENWSNDGVCDSVSGESVEPDGHDRYGFPSWLLVLGLI